MELREAIGRRRSIRFLNPTKPVEKEKIQIMFEAARIASHWGNVQSLRGIALFRDTDAEMIDILQGAIIGWQFRIAPALIIWIVDSEDAVEYQASSLMQLAEVGALGIGSKEVREAGVRDQLLPVFANLGEVLAAVGPCEIDCGQGIRPGDARRVRDGSRDVLHRRRAPWRRTDEAARRSRSLSVAAGPDRGLSA